MKVKNLFFASIAAFGLICSQPTFSVGPTKQQCEEKRASCTKECVSSGHETEQNCHKHCEEQNKCDKILLAPTPEGHHDAHKGQHQGAAHPSKDAGHHDAHKGHVAQPKLDQQAYDDCIEHGQDEQYCRESSTK